MLYSVSPLDSLVLASLIGGFFKYSLIWNLSFCLHDLAQMLSSYVVFSSGLYLFWNRAEKKNPALCHRLTIPHWENVCVHAFMPLEPSAHCKLIPYVYSTRGLWVTSKYERAIVRELQGAHLNSPSVLVQKEMMFQSVEERSFLKGPIDNQWGSVRWKIRLPPATDYHKVE